MENKFISNYTTDYNGKNYKRQYRDVEEPTKKRISQALRHRSKSETHKENISKSMLEYWKHVPYRYRDGDQFGEDSEEEEDGTDNQ